MAGLPLNRYVAASECSHARSSLESASAATYRGRAHNLDNLKEGVLTPDIYDPALNPLYRDVLAHYGVVAVPCRVGRSRSQKGRSKPGVGHTKKTPLRGLRFETIEEAQAYLDRWEAHWADTRIHGTTKREVAVMFAEEQPACVFRPIVNGHSGPT